MHDPNAVSPGLLLCHCKSVMISTAGRLKPSLRQGVGIPTLPSVAFFLMSSSDDYTLQKAVGDSIDSNVSRLAAQTLFYGGRHSFSYLNMFGKDNSH